MKKYCMLKLLVWYDLHTTYAKITIKLLIIIAPATPDMNGLASKWNPTVDKFQMVNVVSQSAATVNNQNTIQIFLLVFCFFFIRLQPGAQALFLLRFLFLHPIFQQLKDDLRCKQNLLFLFQDSQEP